MAEPKNSNSNSCMQLFILTLRLDTTKIVSTLLVTKSHLCCFLNCSKKSALHMLELVLWVCCEGQLVGPDNFFFHIIKKILFRSVHSLDKAADNVCIRCKPDHTQKAILLWCSAPSILQWPSLEFIQRLAGDAKHFSRWHNPSLASPKLQAKCAVLTSPVMLSAPQVERDLKSSLWITQYRDNCITLHWGGKL